jgi:hypothetical protein
MSPEYLKSLLHYCPETGIFTTVRAGHVVGTTTPNGYISIGHNKQTYYAHRLAWLYMIGRWPADTIDHINTERGDNRFLNLREATKSENHGNRNPRIGLKGVTRGSKNSWSATITCKGKTHYLGSFRSPEAASAAYRAAAERLFGEYANHLSLL